MEKEVYVATVGAPRGLRGAVTLRVRSDDPVGRLAPGTLVFTDHPQWPQLEVAKVHSDAKSLSVTFVQISDRNGAEELRGVDLRIAVDLDEEAESDSEGFYPDELNGYTVIDPAGHKVGEVVGLELGSGQDRLLLNTSSGRVVLPFVFELVPKISRSERRLVAIIPAGLADL